MSELFSERYGYVVKQVQFGSLDRVTKGFLWEKLYFSFFLEIEIGLEKREEEPVHKAAISLLLNIDRDIFHQPSQNAPEDIKRIIQGCENAFFNSAWYFPFDIIEYVVQNSEKVFPSKKEYKKALKAFTIELNKELEKHKAMYRLVASMIVPITNEAELSTISTALEATESFKTVDTHIIKALKFLANRSNPDYHNSIKESVSALEALLRLIANKPHATLSDAMREIKKKGVLSLNIHLENTVKGLYNWASDEGAIRHADKGDSMGLPKCWTVFGLH